MKLIYLFFVLSLGHASGSLANPITASIKETEESGRTLYRMSLKNNPQSPTDVITVSFGASCSLGKFLDYSRYDFQKLPITNTQNNYSPNILNATDTFVVDSDNYLKSASIEGSSSDPKKLYLSRGVSKSIDFYMPGKNNNLMLDLPICLEVAGGGRNQIEIIVSPEAWIDADQDFDIDGAIAECKKTYEGEKIDPNEGDIGYKCMDPKFSYIAAIPYVQFACVIEKRLEYRLSQVEKNANLQLLKSKIEANPNKQKLKENYDKKLAALKTQVSNAIVSQKKEVENLKDKSDKILANMNKSCKQNK